MFYELIRPLLLRMDAERAHHATLRLLALGHRLRMARQRVPELPTQAMGLTFANPVGLAAGLDKNGACIDALAALGFGFIEVGTVTPRPQPGNPKPRMFRLPEHKAVINRLGFNNDGVEALLANVERARWRGVLGINIGRNKDTPNERAVGDYLHCLERVYPLASYVTVNISSPNTQGLRDLQEEELLKRFVGGLRERQEQLASQHGRYVPMLIKIAPDLDQPALDGMAAVMLEAKMDGLICTNTTIARDAVAGHRHGGESGGLSGKPLLKPSTAVLRGLRDRLGPQITLIGVGGICAGKDAAAKIQAGANLVQCYSGLIYRGPRLVGECIEAIAAKRAPHHR